MAGHADGRIGLAVCGKGKGVSVHALFTSLDLIGTFAFAISGAAAARQKKLDLFGIVTLAYVTACGGGIIRDVCIGELPPAGLSEWRYAALSIVAAGMGLGYDRLAVGRGAWGRRMCLA